jgi:hypothetical protein
MERYPDLHQATIKLNRDRAIQHMHASEVLSVNEDMTDDQTHKRKWP